MKSKVYLKKTNAYDLDQIESFVRESVTVFRGSDDLFRPGQTVLLKPNLLRGARPNRCITTHPAVLEAVCRVLRDCGASRIDISDSPAMGSLEYAGKRAGYGYLFKQYGARLIPFRHPVPLDIEENIPHLKIAGELKDYDHIINVPKFKSHRQMTLTLSIKNLFGCVIGKRKPVLHCLVQNDKIKFGKMLVDIAKHIQPSLTLVDGIQAMQGNGPMQGTPYPLGLLAAAVDMTALDRILTEIVQVPLTRVYALEAARQKNFGQYDLEHIEVVGESEWKSLRVSDFRLADFEMDITFNPFRVVKSFLKQLYETGIREKLAG